MHKQTILRSILIVSVFIISFYGIDILNFFTSMNYPNSFFKELHLYSWWIIPSSLLVAYLYGFKNIPMIIGLNKGLLTGFAFSIISVLPMILSSAIVGQFNDNINLGDILHTTIFAGFFEEFLFRGFLFGILFRYLKWGFIPASTLGAVIFGLGHLYQGSTPIESTGIFLVTAMGAIWFAWLYIEWDNNLYIPIFLHIMMNSSWILFEVSENALGGIFTNIFRAFTITLTIIITIRFHKNRGLNIKRKNLIINNIEH